MLSRRRLLKTIGISSAGAVLSACGAASTPARATRSADITQKVATPPVVQWPDNRSLPTKPTLPEQWLVGSYLGLSDGQFGLETKQGIECALARINQKPVLGRPMRVLFEDIHGSDAEAAPCVKKLIDEDHVIAIIGSVMSSASLVGGRIANTLHVPTIATGATNPSVTEIGPYAFRICFIDPMQGEMAAEYIIKKRGLSKIGLFFASDDPYSNGVAQAFKARVSKMGSRILLEADFSVRETDFSKHLKSAKAKKLETIFAPVFYDQISVIAQQARTLGVPTSLFVGGDGWIHPGVFADVEGGHFIDHFASDAPTAKTKELVAEFNARFGYGPTSLAATGYDATMLLADAIGRAKEPTSDAIRDALATTKDFVGATGKITMDEHRNPQKPGVVQRIENGVPFYETSVGPGADET